MAERILRAVDHLFDHFGIAEITVMWNTAYFIRYALRESGNEIADENAGTSRGERPRQGRADSLSGTGDNDMCPVKRHQITNCDSRSSSVMS